MNEWYETLNRPLLTPPNWVFGPVWSVLYLMIAVSLILFLKRYGKKTKFKIYLLISSHLISNFLWTTLFFGMKTPGWALLDIIFLDLTLILIIKHFWKNSRFLSALLFPYLIWVLFATYLNAAFFILNNG